MKLASLVTVALGLFASTIAGAAQLVVDDDLADCPGAQFTTIQDAVTAASAGDTVVICAGRYVERVRVDKTLNLFGPQRGVDGRGRTLSSPGEAVVASPRPFILAADGIVLDGLTVLVVLDDSGEGSGILSSGSFSGYRVQNCVVDADGVTGFFPGSSGAVTTVARRNHFYNRLGVATSDDEPTAIAHNLLVVDNLFTASTIGIFSGEDTDVRVSGNVLEGGGGIIVESAQSVAVTGNVVRGAQVAGLSVFTARQVVLRKNVVTGGADIGIRLFGANQDVKVTQNRVDTHARGIALTATSGNQILGNASNDNSIVGITVSADSAGNRLRDNASFGNATLDCEDQSTGAGTLGTANTWLRNQGDLSSPPGLCVAR
jgi:putative cofactor-binding repeat protein